MIYSRPWHRHMLSISSETGRGIGFGTCEHSSAGTRFTNGLLQLDKRWDDIRIVVQIMATSWHSTSNWIEKNINSTYRILSCLTLIIDSSMEDIDIYVGGTLERSVPGGTTGPLFTCLIAMQFHRYKVGDRFWFERPGHTGFTEGKFDYIINTLRARKSIAVFECIFFYDNCCSLIPKSPKCVPHGPASNTLALIQIMAWRQTDDSCIWIRVWIIASLSLDELTLATSDPLKNDSLSSPMSSKVVIVTRKLASWQFLVFSEFSICYMFSPVRW